MTPTPPEMNRTIEQLKAAGCRVKVKHQRVGKIKGIFGFPCPVPLSAPHVKDIEFLKFFNSAKVTNFECQNNKSAHRLPN